MSALGNAGAAPDEGAAAQWPVGPARPRPPAGVVDVWLADLAACGEEPASALSAAELARAGRILDRHKRSAWQRSRGVLRELLGRYLSCDSAAVALAVDDQGKPTLAGPQPVAPLHFNLSHTGDLAVYAFSADAPVGVDVQTLRDDRSGEAVDHIALARRVFGEHEAQRLLLVEPARREWEFMRAWTRYEAELKWRGSGIGGAGRRRETADGAMPWIVELDLSTARTAAAVALSDRATELQRWSFIRGS